MKKTTIAISAILVCVILLASCGGPKTAISAEEFKEKAEQAGLTVMDTTIIDLTEDGWFDIESSCIAKGNNYRIEFSVFSTEQQAAAFYNEYKIYIESMKGSSSSYSDVNLSNYNKYTQTSAGIYSVVSRIDNTVVYASASADYKLEINDFLKDIGY